MTPDCTGRHHLFPECARCSRLLPVTGQRPANPILPDVRFGDEKWECVSFRAPDKQQPKE